jgi:hypothetical protein
VWLKEKKLDQFYPRSNISCPEDNNSSAPGSSDSSGNSTNKTSCSNPYNELVNSTFLKIEPFYTNVFSSPGNSSDYIGFAGIKDSQLEIHTFDLSTGALVSKVKLNNTSCLSGSDGNIALGIYACIQSHELLLFSTITGEKVGNFPGLKTRELEFGDFSNYIYFAALGDEYFGADSRGSYGVIMTDYYSQQVFQANPSNPQSNNPIIQGVTPGNYSELLKFDFTDYCLKFNVYTS